MDHATCSQPMPWHEAKHQRLAGSPSNENKQQMLREEGESLHEAENISKAKLYQTSSPEESMGAGRDETRHVDLPQERPALSLSDYFALVREANPNRAHVLICALHATLLEAGWLPAWSEQVSPSPIIGLSGTPKVPFENRPSLGGEQASLNKLCDVTIWRTMTGHSIPNRTCSQAVHCPCIFLLLIAAEFIETSFRGSPVVEHDLPSIPWICSLNARHLHVAAFVTKV